MVGLLSVRVRTWSRWARRFSVAAGITCNDLVIMFTMDLALAFIMVCRTHDLTACASRSLHALLLVACSLSCLGLPFLGAPDLAFFFLIHALLNFSGLISWNCSLKAMPFCCCSSRISEGLAFSDKPSSSQLIFPALKVTWTPCQEDKPRCLQGLGDTTSEQRSREGDCRSGESCGQLGPC